MNFINMNIVDLIIMKMDTDMDTVMVMEADVDLD
jgi:hypothetical protein